MPNLCMLAQSPENLYATFAINSKINLQKLLSQELLTQLSECGQPQPLLTRSNYIQLFYSSMVHDRTPKKSKSILSIFRRRRNRIGSVTPNEKDMPTRSISKKCMKSCPSFRSPTDLKDEEVEADFSDELNDTMGFITFLDENGKNALREKIEEKKKTNLERKIPPPTLITDLITLTTIFNSYPKEDIIDLIHQHEGNGEAVYEFLVSSGAELSMKDNPDTLTSEPNIHFTTPYYCGECPPKGDLEKLFATEDPGVFITYYKFEPESDTLQYYLCFKNILDKITEKPIQGPVVPAALKTMLDLTNYTQTEKRNIIPCLHLV